jgi:hypothetical protein
MRHLEIDERKQFVALLIHHMMYSDDKYLHVLSLVDEWESETPTTNFDFSYNELSKLKQPTNQTNQNNQNNRRRRR